MVLARTGHFLFDAFQLSLRAFVFQIGCQKVLMRDADARFFRYAEKKLNRYCLWVVCVRRKIGITFTKIEN